MWSFLRRFDDVSFVGLMIPPCRSGGASFIGYSSERHKDNRINIGAEMLKKSVDAGNLEAMIYYGKLQIKGGYTIKKNIDAVNIASRRSPNLSFTIDIEKSRPTTYYY
ncbi:3168_t:CDS:2 [Scutellospora calospora]|uniref:3168_t:CDS:1 n=1 Tax=Scutellospora calospora TaxID=85575 RepID=A0ACA9K661_9GLOM|nr:3168_t:CDS:2 [Scutellospora calospora]